MEWPLKATYRPCYSGVESTYIFNSFTVEAVYNAFPRNINALKQYPDVINKGNAKLVI